MELPGEGTLQTVKYVNHHWMRHGSGEHRSPMRAWRKGNPKASKGRAGQGKKSRSRQL